MMLNPHDDPQVSAEFSLADYEAETLALIETAVLNAQRAVRTLQETVLEYPSGVAHYRDSIADLANDFLKVATQAPR